MTTEFSNKGIEKSLQKKGIAVVRVRVGDRYVLQKMLSLRYNLGGESSGHTIFLDHNTTGDGLITTLQFLSLIKRTGKSVSKLSASTQLLPQISLNVKVREKRPLTEMPDVQQAIREIEGSLNGNGRLVVRYSGTENMLRIMIEGEDQAAISKTANDLAAMVKRQIGI